MAYIAEEYEYEKKLPLATLFKQKRHTQGLVVCALQIAPIGYSYDTFIVADFLINLEI